MKKNIQIMVGVCLSSSMLVWGCSEDLPSYSELKLDKTDVIIQADGENPTAQISIVSGNGNYKLTVADENVATATLNGNQIVLNGLKNGTTIVTVVDWAKYSSVLNVRVKEDFDLTLEKAELAMYLNENPYEEVSITTGNGGYEIQSSDENVATAVLTESGKVAVTAISCGHCEVKVKDADGLEQKIAVTVYDDHLVLADMGGKVWLVDETADIEIVSGNGEYQIQNENPDTASAELIDNIIRVKGLKKGETILTVTDKMGLTVQYVVKVSGAFELGETEIPQLYIEDDALEIAIVDGSGDYTIEAGEFVSVTLSEDKTKFIVDGIDKKVALNQIVKITDNILHMEQNITIDEINYRFETYGNARWFVEGELKIVNFTLLTVADGKVVLQVGEKFTSKKAKNGFSLHFDGDVTPGVKGNGELYHLSKTGKEENPITISDVEVVKRELDEGRGENGKYWIRFKEDGKSEWSYIVTWS